MGQREGIRRRPTPFPTNGLTSHSDSVNMQPIFATTCSIASKIFEIAQTLEQHPERKTRGVFFISEGASAHIQDLVCEASQRAGEAYDIPDPDGTGPAKREHAFLPFSDLYWGCVKHIKWRLSNNRDAVFHIGGCDNLNLWELASLLNYFIKGQIGSILSSDMVSLSDATFIIRTSSGLPGQTPSFESFLKRFQISPEEAARSNFYDCFE
jgi:hypothetical protein